MDKKHAIEIIHEFMETSLENRKEAYSLFGIEGKENRVEFRKNIHDLYDDIQE